MSGEVVCRVPGNYGTWKCLIGLGSKKMVDHGFLTVWEVGRSWSLGTPGTVQPPQRGDGVGLTNKGRMETSSTTAEKQEEGRLKEHRLHL